MWKKMRNFVYDSCDMMELVMAVIVLISVVVAAISLWKPFTEFLNTRFDRGSFLNFVGYVFNILIGIEFLKMLSRPSLDTVLEVLTFLVARHMVIEETSVMENFFSIASISLLFATKKYLNLPSHKGGTDIFVTEYDGDGQKESQEQTK